MRRKDREIVDHKELLAIMRKCDSCSVAFFDEEFPYIIPLNFGVTYIDDKFNLYFHGAREGKKLELLQLNNHVAFEMSGSHKLLIGDKACDTTMEFESVCGNGTMEIVAEGEKRKALIAIMNQYQNKEQHEFDDRAVNAVTVLSLEVKSISGKRLRRG